MSEPKDLQNWKKGDPPIDIGWDEDPDDAPREMSADEQALHEENMAKLNRIMRAYGILKIGLTALVIVVIIKVFGR
jgi:hypothetical protein